MTSVLLVALAVLVTTGFAGDCGCDKIEGAKEFKANCAICHPEGGNIFNSNKTLSKKDLENNGIKTTEDIVEFMRNPGPGMAKFDKKAISDKEAMAIAEHIIKSFK